MDKKSIIYEDSMPNLATLSVHREPSIPLKCSLYIRSPT